MCEVVTIAMAGAAVAQGAAKAYGDHQAAQAAAAAGREGAIIAENAASDALQRGEVEAGSIQMRSASIEGRQRAGFGASGVDVNQGTAARTVEDTASITALDMETARNNAQREAWGLEVEATNRRNHANAVADQGDLAVLGDLLGGAVSASSDIIGGAQSTGYFRKTTPKPPGVQ